MNSRSFFRKLWRFNAIAIAAVAMMALAYGAMAGFFIARDLLRTRNVASIAPAQPTSNTKAGEEPAQTAVPTLEVAHFSRVLGHATMWAPLTSHDRMSFSAYSKEATNTRDYLFYDVAAGTYHRLLGRDDRLISSMTFLPRPKSPTTSEDAANAFGPLEPAALLITIIDKDSNGDGRLSVQDHKTLAIASPSGTGLKTLLSGVDQLLGHTVWEDGSATLMLRDASGTTRAIRLVLSDFTVDRDDAYGGAAAPPG